MDPSRQALRRTPVSDQVSNPVDLPCYEAEELTDFQVSVPMPVPVQPALAGDREMTEALRAGARGARGEPTDPISRTRRKRGLERTQPVHLALEPPPREHGVDERDEPPQGPAPDYAAGSGPRGRREGVNPGDLLCGRYVVVEKIDHCGMGLIYKALDRQREKAGSPLPWVALKLARPDVDAAETSACLRQEFLKLSQLNHPNIVSVFDLACDDGLDFMVLEWLSGETLADLLSRITTRRLALDKATDIVRSTARALAHAHELGIVHGDVKPANIFLTHGRTVKVLDFGSSGTTTSDNDPERNWATRAYASCEVLEGNAPQPHDDVFALGVTAYCLLTGGRPFGDLDAVAARDRRARPDPLPADAQEKCPALSRALKYDAIDRQANATLFLQEFDEPVNEPPSPPATRSPTVAYGALAATLMASVVWWSVQSVGGLPPDARIALENGNKALAEGRLLEPASESAYSYYSAVLDAEPANRVALDGLESIAEVFLTRARESLAANDAGAAQSNLALARRVSPGHFGIAVIEDLVASHGRELLDEARRAADTDLVRAQQWLTRAEALLPVDHRELMRVREALSRQAVENRVDRLLQEIDARVLSERLTVPRGDSAVDLLQSAKELAPDDERIRAATDRIMTALLFQAMFSISNADLDDAEDFLAAAKSMGTRHIALARAEYELAKARRAAFAARNDDRR